MAAQHRADFADHEPDGVRGLAEHYLKDLVYGANDGIITTFAVVAGVAGAQLEARIVLLDPDLESLRFNWSSEHRNAFAQVVDGMRPTAFFADPKLDVGDTSLRKGGPAAS